MKRRPGVFDLELTDEQQALRDTLASFATDCLRPAAADAESDPRVAAKLRDELAGLDMRLGAGGPDGPPDPMSWVVAAESLATGDPGLAYALMGSMQAQMLLAWCGDDRVAPDPAVTGSVLLYEGFGRSPAELTTTARPEGRSWRLDGVKVSVLYPGTADVAVVIARRADTGELAAFLLDWDADGVSVEDDDAGGGRLALLAAPTGTVRLDGVTVDDSARIGSSAGGAPVGRAVANCRLTVAAIEVGTAAASLAYASAWATQRVAFGKPLAAFEGVAFPLADLATEVDAARLTVWDAASGLPTDGYETLTDAAVAKAATAAVLAGREGVQLLGVHGITADHPVERWYRSAAALSAIDFDPCRVPLRLR